MDNDEDDRLDLFLSAATEGLEEKLLNNKSKESSLDEIRGKQQTLEPINIFDKETNLQQTKDNENNENIVHGNYKDSSEDEDDKYFESSRYNECGKAVKNLLQSNDSVFSAKECWISNKNRPRVARQNSFQLKANDSNSPTPSTSKIAEPPKVLTSIAKDVYMDPIFGLRIVNPLISSTSLKDCMKDREAISFAALPRFLQFSNAKDRDWVIAGVIIGRSPVRTSQSGKSYTIWTLSDLKDDLKTVSLFLFSGAFNDLKKATIGTVIGVLNPNVLEKSSSSKDVATLSISNSQKVMIFGQSKDYGICRSKRKNGEPCTSVVNLSTSDYCLYHIQQGYKACSNTRGELQGSFRQGLNALRNKVLGKNEVFYAGKSYMAIPAKKSRKLQVRDNKRLEALDGLSSTSNNIVKAKKKKGTAAQHRLEVNPAQRQKDLELLRKLGGIDDLTLKTPNTFTGKQAPSITTEESKSLALETIKKLKNKQLGNQKIENDLNKKDISNTEQKVETFPNKSKLGSEIKSDSTNTSDVFNKDSKSSKKNADVIRKTENLKENTRTSNCQINSSEKPNDGKINTENNVDDGLFEYYMNLEYDEPVLNNNTNSSGNSSFSSTTKGPSICLKNKENDKSIKGCQSFQEKLKEKLKNVSILNTLTPPKLSGSNLSIIDLNKPLHPRAERAKLNALNFVQKHGPIQREDPNSIKSAKKRKVEPIMNPEIKKSKLQQSDVISDRFKKMLAANSSHVDLLEQREDEEKDKYFKKLEMKEKIEEKMTSTYKVPCKAVRCLKCKYTNFSAAELCKKERHPLKVFDAVKRFFKCGDCGNRTVTLGVVPTKECKNCGGGKWERTGMMKEKTVVPTAALSIRGGEQKFINSVATDANINLLVPDE